MQIKDSVVVQTSTRIRPQKTVKMAMKGIFTLEQAIVGILMDAGENNKTLPRKYAIYHTDSKTYFDITTNILAKRLNLTVVAQKEGNPMEKLAGYECEFDHNDGVLVVDACYGLFNVMKTLGGQI